MNETRACNLNLIPVMLKRENVEEFKPIYDKTMANHSSGGPGKRWPKSERINPGMRMISIVDPVEPDTRARCPACHAPIVEDAFGKSVCLRCRLSDDRFLKLDEDAQLSFVEAFLNYLEEHAINRSHGYALGDLFMDAARVEDEPPQLLPKRVISQILRAQEAKASEKATWRALRSKEHPDANVPNVEELAEAELMDFNASVDRWSRDLDSYDSRCVLYVMRAIFAFLDPASALRTGSLERHLASDHFLLLDTFGRQLVVAEFLNYMDVSEVNQTHNDVLIESFCDAVTEGNL